jgi:putative hydrolase of the HAD superfamily
LLNPILFDLDDTLLDRHATVWQFVRNQYQRMELTHLPYDVYCSRFIELDAHGYTPKPKLFKTLLEEFELHATVDALVEDFGRYSWQECILFNDTLPVLEALKERGHSLGIITNGSREYQRTKLKTPGLASCFDLIVVSGEEGIAKPDVGIFQLAADRLGVTPADCVFVGDNPSTDILGAHQAGMETVWLRRHIDWPGSYTWEPDYTIRELRELLTLH